MPDIAKLVTELRKQLPAWPYIAIAIGVAIFGHFLDGADILGFMRRATLGLLDDLYVLSPLNVGGAFYYQLTGCTAGYENGTVFANCANSDATWEHIKQTTGTGAFAILLWPLLQLYLTAVAVWEHSGWMGRIIYLATLPLGMFAAREAVIAASDNRTTFTGKRIPEDWTFLGWAMFIVLIPAFASLAALALQWLLILCIWLFGQALAFVTWLFALVAGPIALARMGYAVVKDAKEFEHASKLIGPKEPPHG